MNIEKAKLLSAREIVKKFKEAKTDEERYFYVTIFNKRLQESHEKVIKNNLF